MQYKLELNSPSSNRDLVYHNIVFDTFKINIIERYGGKTNGYPKLLEAIFKVRTIDNTLIQRKDGNARVKLRDEVFVNYSRLSQIFKSYEYKNRLANRDEIEQKFIYFILELVIANYNL
ncbi:hypothetical protein SAMN05421796_1072 [Chryseobacterium piscicola]|jgi:hypothetical protein|uniref:Prevent-host-death protein n=1 Tax=Chryseobacterium piscicola TaxID=551459 RepID=A0A1N7N7G9_9FLAO|nr:prevent-host-death protein [Chryseobacterium piscicola]PQA89818.1 prevent-host-death protein [Chryseobacterium piscicola]SIS94317.1 hypothetical protein SAMN05421796_1072 [Chryseobacterium piscicola]